MTARPVPAPPRPSLVRTLLFAARPCRVSAAAKVFLRALLVTTLFACAAPVHAQDTATPQARPAVSDSVIIGVPDTIRLAQDSAVAPEGKSPWGAVLRSAVLPGWGQYYTEQYWKIPLIVGVSGFLIYGIVTENKEYQHYADLYEASITPDNPSGDLTLKSYREYYRDRRDTYAVWMLVTYLVQLADAYVDAHLYDFDVSDDLSGSVTVLPGAVALTLRW